MGKFPIIIHVPHSSTIIPLEIREDILLPDDELEIELLRMTDWYTDEIVAIGEKYGNIIKNDFSRLILGFGIRKLTIRRKAAPVAHLLK